MAFAEWITDSFYYDLNAAKTGIDFIAIGLHNILLTSHKQHYFNSLRSASSYCVCKRGYSFSAARILLTCGWLKKKELHPLVGRVFP